MPAPTSPRYRSAPARALILNPTDPETLYELIDEIASGAFGTVYRATYLETNEAVALKICCLEDTQSTLDELLIEVEILKRCSHPNIVKCFGAHHKGNDVVIGMELCGGGAISDILKYEKVGIEEPLIAYFMRETLKALQYLHSIHIIHRDIKGENILMTNDGHIKLVDFGVSKDVARDNFATSFIGTPYFMSPEVISCKAFSSFYNEKTDIWALGITAIELGDCQPPLYDVPPMRALLQIPRREPPTLASPENWSKEFNDFLATCLKKDPKQRPNCTELLKHPFLQKACTPEVVVAFIERKNRLKSESEGGQEEFLEGEEGEIGEEEQGGEEDEQALAEFLQELSKNAPEGTLLETGVAGDDDLELMDEDDINSWLQTDKTDKPAKNGKEEEKLKEPEEQTVLDSAPVTTRRPKPNPNTSSSSSSAIPAPPVHSMLKKKPSAGSNSKLPPTPSGAQTKRMPSLAGMNATKGGRNTSASALNRPQPTMAGFTIAGRAAFKKQASGAILKEMKKVEDHKRFLQLAKALGKLVEQHKNQHQRLLRQQQKEIQEFVVTNHLRDSQMSARRGDKASTSNEDRMVEKEAEQLAKQHQQSKRQVVSRQSAERQGMQIFHMNQVSCARSDAKGSEEKLRDVHELELRLLIEEHDLIMGHFQESGELDVEHLEQEHFQTMNHQGIVHKSQLDQIQAKVAQTQDRIKQRFAKFLFPHYEKKCQLEREQQQEMQKAEQLELNRQAQTEYKKFQKQKQEDLKKKKDYIKAAQLSKERKQQLIQEVEVQIKQQMDDYEVEWALKKEEEADLLKDIQIFQQETLNEVQRTRLAELHERQDAEMKYAQLPKVQLMIEHVRARLAALKDQKEQITHLRRSNHESRLELLLANSSEELKKFELHSKELHPNGGIETPRRKKIRQDLKNQYEKRLKHLNEIAQVEGEASSQLSTDPELETDLARLLQEEQQLIAAAPTVEDDLTPLMNSARQDPTSARSRSPARPTSSRGTSVASARGSPQPAAPSSHRRSASSVQVESDSHEPQAPRGRRSSFTQNDLPPVELPTTPKKSAGANSNRLEPVTSFIRRRGTSFGSVASSPGQIPTPASTNGVTASPSDPSPSSGRARGRTVHTDKNLSQSAPLTPPPLSSIPAPATPPTLVSSSSSSALKSILLKPLSKRESTEKKTREPEEKTEKQEKKSPFRLFSFRSKKTTEE